MQVEGIPVEKVRTLVEDLKAVEVWAFGDDANDLRMLSEVGRDPCVWR